MRRDLIVVGAGPAGITTGMYGMRSGLETLVVDKGICGGLSNELEEVKKLESHKRRRARRWVRHANGH